MCSQRCSQTPVHTKKNERQAEYSAWGFACRGSAVVPGNVVSGVLLRGALRVPHARSQSGFCRGWTLWRCPVPVTHIVGKRDSPAELSSLKVGSRWRSDESSEDEADQIDKHLVGGPCLL
ncbi:hypothetical protein KSP40_PGU022323 [Platanthera guangdongensis]|uniref:Uncharacterized protein n=1 Tax=Platanthera guangdongensis TaxID=2320717 RepID=A0ABR2LRB7_9ASPA